MIRALPDSGCRVYWLQSVHPDQPAIAWCNSGIGATRKAISIAFWPRREVGYRVDGETAADLLTLEIGVNDTIHADVETVTGSRAALTAVITQLRRHGVANTALMGTVPVRADFQPGPWRAADAYQEIYRPIAREERVPLLDCALRWSSYVSAFEAGYLADQVHPTPAGHADMGAMAAALLLAAATPLPTSSDATLC